MVELGALKKVNPKLKDFWHDEGPAPNLDELLDEDSLHVPGLVQADGTVGMVRRCSPLCPPVGHLLLGGGGTGAGGAPPPERPSSIPSNLRLQRLIWRKGVFSIQDGNRNTVITMADGTTIINPNAAQRKAKRTQLLQAAIQSEQAACNLIASVSPKVSFVQGRPAVSVSSSHFFCPPVLPAPRAAARSMQFPLPATPSLKILCLPDAPPRPAPQLVRAIAQKWGVNVSERQSNGANGNVHVSYTATLLGLAAMNFLRRAQANASDWVWGLMLKHMLWELVLTYNELEPCSRKCRFQAAQIEEEADRRGLRA